MSMYEYKDLFHRATAAAEGALIEILRPYHKRPSGKTSTDLSTEIVEQIVEAAVARIFQRLEAEGAKRQRLEALDVLQKDLCGACVELLDPEAPGGKIGEGDETPGSTELAERALFLGWAERIPDLGEGLGEDGPRFTLIVELHQSVAVRHPLGIAETLCTVIGDLHAGEDRDAVLSLEDLAEAELGAAKSEKAAACLEALRVLVDPDMTEDDEPQARDLIAGWTLEELGKCLAWAEEEFKHAVDATRVALPVPAVVAAFKKEANR